MRRSALSVLTASAIVIVGCNNRGSDGTAPDGPRVAVMYGSDPLADVHVRLHASPTGPVVAQAISAANGMAHFAETPSPEPDRYFVSLASNSDGGWMLETRLFKPADSNIQLKPLKSNKGQRIELPSGAVVPLQTTNQR